MIESTILPGTVDKPVRPVIAVNEKPEHLAHAPERIIPGNVVKHDQIKEERTKLKGEGDSQ